MKITLMVVGKSSTDYIIEGIEAYTRRLTHYIPFEIKTLPDIKNTKAIDKNRQKQLEGENFLKEISSGDYVVLLDERGKEMTSRQFSEFIERKTISVQKQLLFIVGGSYGFSPQMYDRANEKISLSKMTFSHEMVRLFFVEQLYRAMTILRGEPYHHD